MDHSAARWTRGGGAPAAWIFADAASRSARANQFKKNRSEFWRGLTELHNTITAKVDDHAKDDKIQFNDLSNQIWRLRLAVARGNGDETPERHQGPNGDF